MIAHFIKAAALTAMVAVGALSTTAAMSTSAEARDARIEFHFGAGPRGGYRDHYAPRYQRD
jgi:Pyruvate/2-oxoacid:ferredoxin oxidoreductase gamma subunit